jgi:hypothetical protein
LKFFPYIPKVPGPGADLVSLRPIVLINVVFKIVFKALASQLDPISHKIISHNQTAFIRGRNILEGPLTLIVKSSMSCKLKS